MIRRLPLALAASALIALPSTALAGQAPLHPEVTVAKAANKKSRKKATKAPAVTKVSPKNAKVGDTLTISGKNFVPGKGKNQVFFYTAKGGGTFTKAADASKTRLKVVVPDKLAALLPANGEQARILLRVKGKRLGARSVARISPLIAINPDDVGGDAGGGVTGPTACTPKFTDPVSDVDKDLLSDARERQLMLDACLRDSDGDGASDGYEHYSAVDMNSRALPYPFKTPYPNPLFKDDPVDHDGDGLTLNDEYTLWSKYGQNQVPLNYSDGLQSSAEGMTDDVRDADRDGLGNWDESHGRMTAEWWKAQYDGKNGVKETPYPVTFGPVSMIDPDSDGDGVLDGADDTDFDGLTNAFEVERPAAAPTRTVTGGDETNDTVTASGHGFQNGDLILFPELTGGTGLTAGDKYYVVSAAPNTFQVSLSPGGAAIDFTTVIKKSLVREVSGWFDTFVSTGYRTNNYNPDTNRADTIPATPAVDGGYRYYSRVQPFNPCKPVWSDNCHIHWNFGYYPLTEDWMGWGVPGMNQPKQVLPAGAGPNDL